MQTARRISLIIAVLLLLIFAPTQIAGLSDLASAGSAATAHDKSHYYESAAQRLTWRSDLYVAAADTAMDAREYPRAITLFQAARQRGQLTTAARLDLGQAYSLNGDDADAILEWQTLLTDPQMRAAASLSLVQTYHSLARFDDEAQILHSWLAFDPTNPDAHYGLGLLLFADASPDAIALLQTAASNSPALKPQIDALVSALKTALQEPSAAARLTSCGRTLAAIGEWPLAARTFLRATQADPQDGLAWAWLGEARQQTGSAAALPALQQALSLAPGSAEIHGMAGLYWQRHSDWQQALAEFSAAARLQPGTAVWQMSLGDVHTHLGDLVKALADYQAATSLAPADAQTWRALALFSVENNVDVDVTGRDAALQAYALAPADAQNMDALARTLMATAQWDAAESILKKAIAAAPNDAAPVFHLGLLYMQTDRRDLAKPCLLSARSLDPAGPIGSQAAKVLERYFP